MKKALFRVSVLFLATLIMAMPTQARSREQDTDVTITRNESPSVHGFSFVPSEKNAYSSIKKKIVSHQKVNPDVRAWLTIPGTDIDEPILLDQREEADNGYYLYRTWDGKNYPNLNYKNYVTTASYLEYRTTLGENWAKTSRNSTIFGHNWTNLRNPLAIGKHPQHDMFAQLPSYTNLDFLKQNPYIYYSTDQVEGIWKVFAVAYSEDHPNFFYTNPNPGRTSYQNIIDEWKARSLFQSDIEVLTTDRILTLSTCTRWYPDAGPTQRFVVVARLLRDGESESDPIRYTQNPNPKQPLFHQPLPSAKKDSTSSEQAESESALVPAVVPEA